MTTEEKWDDARKVLDKRHKRSAIDSLFELGYDALKIESEYDLIKQKKSRLSARERAFIIDLVES